MPSMLANLIAATQHAGFQDVALDLIASTGCQKLPSLHCNLAGEIRVALVAFAPFRVDKA